MGSGKILAVSVVVAVFAFAAVYSLPASSEDAVIGAAPLASCGVNCTGKGAFCYESNRTFTTASGRKYTRTTYFCFKSGTTSTTQSPPETSSAPSTPSSAAPTTGSTAAPTTTTTGSTSTAAGPTSTTVGTTTTATGSTSTTAATTTKAA